MSKDALGQDKYISKLDNELVKQGLPMNEINKILKMAETDLQCDKACEREKKIKYFKNRLNKSKDLYLSLPETISKNEEEYYKVKKGEAYYKNHILRDKYRSLIEKYRHEQLQKIGHFNNDTDMVLSNYKSAQLYKSRIKELYDDRLKLNKKLKREINNSKKRITTDTRKIFYEDQEIDGLLTYRKFLYITYFILIPILFIVFLIKSKFIPEKQYKKIKNIVILLVFISIYICFAIPAFLKILTQSLFALRENIRNLF